MRSAWRNSSFVGQACYRVALQVSCGDKATDPVEVNGRQCESRRLDEGRHRGYVVGPGFVPQGKALDRCVHLLLSAQVTVHRRHEVRGRDLGEGGCGGVNERRETQDEVVGTGCRGGSLKDTRVHAVC